MKIGVSKEVKTSDIRVALTPNLCWRCVSLGTEVWVEKGAGGRAGFTDPHYTEAVREELIPRLVELEQRRNELRQEILS